MLVVTETDKHGLSITYARPGGKYLFRGFSVEGQAPYVPEDDAPGWVCFDLDVGPTIEDYFTALRELAQMLFCNLGFTAEQVIELLEDF